MDLYTISQAWKYLSWLPKSILRRMFTKEKLSGMVYLDIQPRNTSARVNLGSMASTDVYFQIINMTPFEIELDRAEVEFYCAGVSLKMKHILKQSYASGQQSSFLVSEEISDAKANQIAKLFSENSSAITISCEFNCSLHHFSKHNHSLEGVNVQFINENSRNGT